MKARLLVVTSALFAAIAVGVLACRRSDSDRNSPPAQLVVALENDIQTLDPVALSDPYSSRVVWQIYEGLVGLDERGNPLPLIAQSWTPSSDFRRWTFQIRPGVEFHPNPAFSNANGTRSVTAEDVVYSYTRFAKGFGSFVFSGLVEGFDEFVAGTVPGVTGFRAVAPLQFEVRLTRPDPSFPYRITSPYLGIMPREVVEQDTNAFGRSVAAGTGPFRLLRRTATEVTLERNPRYWRQVSGNLAQVTFRVEKNLQLRLSRFQNGEYGVMQLPTSATPVFFDGNRLKSRFASIFNVYQFETFNVHYLGIDDRQVDDPALRRAIGYVVDKQRIINTLLYGQGRVATGPIPAGMQGYRPPDAHQRDTAAARRELRASGYTGRTLTLLVSDAPNSEQIGELIRSDLASVGIQVRIERVDFNTLISRVFGSDRPELFVLFSEWIYSAPELIIDVYNGAKFPNPNMFGYSNPAVDTLLARLPATSQRAQINQICREVEELAAPDVPAVWLFHLKNTYLTAENLKGFTVNAHNHWDLADASIIRS